MKNLKPFKEYEKIWESKVNENIPLSFNKIKHDLDVINRNPDKVGNVYFQGNHGLTGILSGTLENIIDGMNPDESFTKAADNENYHGDNPSVANDRNKVLDILKSKYGISAKYLNSTEIKENKYEHKYGTSHLAKQGVKLGELVHNKSDLVEGKLYCIVDLGLNEWNGGYKYEGFDGNFHLFKDTLDPRPSSEDHGENDFACTDEEMEEMIELGQIALEGNEVLEAEELAYQSEVKPEEKADDKQIAALEEQIKTYKKLSIDIDTITKKYTDLIEKELGNLPKDQQKVSDHIKAEIERLRIQKIKTDGIVISFRKAYFQPTVAYKALFEKALTKLNGVLKKIILALVPEFTKQTLVPAKVDIKRESLEINEGVLDTISGIFKKGVSHVWNFLKGVGKQLQSLLPGLEDATEDLENITKQIQQHDEKEANREIPKWQASQYESHKRDG